MVRQEERIAHLCDQESQTLNQMGHGDSVMESMPTGQMIQQEECKAQLCHQEGQTSSQIGHGDSVMELIPIF